MAYTVFIVKKWLRQDYNLRLLTTGHWLLTPKHTEQPCRMRGFEDQNGRNEMSLSTEQLVKAEVGEGLAVLRSQEGVAQMCTEESSEVSVRAHVSTSQKM